MPIPKSSSISNYIRTIYWGPLYTQFGLVPRSRSCLKVVTHQRITTIAFVDHGSVFRKPRPCVRPSSKAVRSSMSSHQASGAFLNLRGKVGSHGCIMKYLERAMQSLRTLGYLLITKHWPTSYEIRDIIYMLIPLEACQENHRPLLGEIYTLHGPLSKIQVPRKVMPILILLEARPLKHTLKPSSVFFFGASRLLFLEYYPANESGNET